uniref:Uncharacterized protein n=1 Tax=Glossina brevipalpis TaxID=37001 RepID=A0A1A9WRZ1_9MUSC
MTYNGIDKKNSIMKLILIWLLITATITNDAYRKRTKKFSHSTSELYPKSIKEITESLLLLFIVPSTWPRFGFPVPIFASNAIVQHNDVKFLEIKKKKTKIILKASQPLDNPLDIKIAPYNTLWAAPLPGIK